MDDVRGIEGGSSVTIALSWTMMDERDGEAVRRLLANRRVDWSWYGDAQTGHLVMAMTIDERMVPEMRPWHAKYGVCVPGVTVDRLI